jgi:hypothetical protein
MRFNFAELFSRGEWVLDSRLVGKKTYVTWEQPRHNVIVTSLVPSLCTFHLILLDDSPSPPKCLALALLPPRFLLFPEEGRNFEVSTL